jgi:hypothetical protein
LAEIQAEFMRLQKRIDAPRESVADALTRIFGEQRQPFPEWPKKNHREDCRQSRCSAQQRH